MTWQLKYKSYTLLYRERSASRYLHNVYESSTAGRERAREVGKDRKKEKERERGRE